MNSQNVVQMMMWSKIINRLKNDYFTGGGRRKGLTIFLLPFLPEFTIKSTMCGFVCANNESFY